jgi:hypothetical protein
MFPRLGSPLIGGFTLSYLPVRPLYGSTLRIQGHSTTSEMGDVYRTSAIDPIFDLVAWGLAEAAPAGALDVTKEGQRKGFAASPRRK